MRSLWKSPGGRLLQFLQYLGAGVFSALDCLPVIAGLLMAVNGVLRCIPARKERDEIERARAGRVL